MVTFCRTINALLEGSRARDITKSLLSIQAAPGDTTRTLPLPTRERKGSIGDIDRMSAAIRRAREDPNAPAWRKKLVRQQWGGVGTPDRMAPEQWHSPDPEGREYRKLMRDPRVVKGHLSGKGVPQVGKERHAVTQREILSKAFPGRKIYTCKDAKGGIRTGTAPCPKSHKHLGTALTKTQAAISRIS